MKHDSLDEFLSYKMTVDTDINTHLARMEEIFHWLIVIFVYWTTDTFVISVILRSLPPSYRDFVDSYVMKDESVELPAFLEMVRNVQVENIEVIYLTGIFYIQML